MEKQKIIWTPVPQILEITFFEMPESAQSTQERLVKDYELDFFVRGNGKIYLDDFCYDIAPQHIMFRRPGQRCHSTAPYSCYALTLSFFPELNLKDGYYRKRLGKEQPEIDHHCFNNMLPYFGVRNTSTYQKLFSSLHDLNILGIADQEKNEVLLTDLFLNLLTDSIHQINSESENANNNIHPALQKLCSWIRVNLREKISLSDMAKVANMHPNYLHRIFSKQIGISPNEYIEQLRLEQACQLLIDTDNLIEWVSEQSGFNSVAYFTKRFKKHFGITPHDFRKSHK